MSIKDDDDDYSPGELVEFTVTSRPVYREEWLGYLAGTAEPAVIAVGDIVKIIRKLDPTAEGRTVPYGNLFLGVFYLVDVAHLNLIVDDKHLEELIVYQQALVRLSPLKQLARCVDDSLLI